MEPVEASKSCFAFDRDRVSFELHPINATASNANTAKR
jgi:hypothetical protein